jgi:dTDP-4-dehydrorhamnose 3,5-epimerase
MEIKKISFKNKVFKEIKIFKKEIFRDNRGCFTRIFCEKEFQKNDIKFQIKQINFSSNKSKGIIRGMHYQDFFSKEAKIVICLKGRIHDVVVDIRKNSQTYLKSFSLILSENNNKVLYIPPGFAHGFQTLENDTEILYLHNKNFNKKIYRTINPLDTKLNIKWPIKKKIISKKDLSKKYL